MSDSRKRGAEPVVDFFDPSTPAATDGNAPPGKRSHVARQTVTDGELSSAVEEQRFRAFINRMGSHSYSGRSATERVKKIVNVRVLRGGKLVQEDVWIRRGKIIDPQQRFWEAQRGKEFDAHQIINGRGCIVAPGFIDIQINGARGVDFSSPDLTREQVDFVCAYVLQHGVTSICPTMVTSAPETYRSVLPLLEQRAGGVEQGAAILGAHVEGPFISSHKYGAHAKEHIVSDVTDPSVAVRVYGSVHTIRLVTVAPELPGAPELIQKLAAEGIVVSLGHSEGDVHHALRACEAGARCITHLFNAMKTFHHRDPGLVGLLGHPTNPPFYGVIADGVHSHPMSVNLAYKAHPDGLILVTDAIQAMGLGAGLHSLGDMSVEIKDGRAFIAGTGTLAGSIMPMDECVRNLVKMTGCSLEKALEAASLTPARLLGLAPKKGTLEHGADADLVLLDPDTHVVSATFIGGEPAWIREGFSIRTV